MHVVHGERGPRARAARRLGRPAEARVRRQRRARRATRAASNQAILAVTPPASPPAPTPGKAAAEAGLELLRRDEQGRQLRARHRQVRHARPGRDPDRRLLGLQRADRPRHAQRQPAGERRRPEDAASSPASTCRRSAPSPRTRTRRSCGWSTSIPTRASSSGSRATATRSASTTSPTRGKIPQELLDKLPPPEAYEAAVFPTLEQQEAMAAVIKGGWDSVVGANVPSKPARRPPAAPPAPPARLPPGDGRMAQPRPDTSARPARPDAGRGSASCPSSLFALLFLILPTMQIVVGAFRNPAGDFTLAEHRATCSRRRSSAPSGSRSASASPRPSSAASSASPSPGR